MQSMKESAADAGASAKAGMKKAKSSMQEKVEKMKTRDPTEKEMARERKVEKKEEAEQRKQETLIKNAASQAGFAAGGFNRGGDDVNRRTTTTAGTGYDAGRRVGYNNNVGVNQDDPYYGTYE